MLMRTYWMFLRLTSGFLFNKFISLGRFSPSKDLYIFVFDSKRVDPTISLLPTTRD